jgi:hypothetical protein
MSCWSTMTSMSWHVVDASKTSGVPVMAYIDLVYSGIPARVAALNRCVSVVDTPLG